MLLGLLESDFRLGIDRALLVLADPVRRTGRITRFSVFVSVPALLEANAKGWSEDRTTSGETVRCFLPPLLPVVVSALRDDAIPPSSAMQAVIEGAGLALAAEPEIPAAAERARRAAMTLVRDARFGRRVIAAYNGRCAMCGFAADLVEAAHIYPVSAPGSHDEPWNGIALCPNHHLAFDRHLLAVHPDTREIVFSPVIHSQVPDSPAMRAFVEGTFTRLAEPDDMASRPVTSMFSERYLYYPKVYTWISGHVSSRRHDPRLCRLPPEP